MSEQSRAEFEEAIAQLVVPVENYWPRPWFTRHDPMTCSLLLVGASSAKTFRVEDLPRREDFLDAHFNRNGLSCQGLYDRLAGSPSPTRQNIGRATDMLEAAGWRVMQTNVTCASAPFDRDISLPARKHGTDIFQTVVTHVPWRAMVVFGAGAAKRLDKTLRIDVPAPADLQADPDADPRIGCMGERPILVIPTLAPPAFRQTVWPHLERCMSALGQPDQVSRSVQGATRADAGPEMQATEVYTASAAGNVASMVEGSSPVQEAARGLDVIMEDNPHLLFKCGSSQVSIWRPHGKQAGRLFRLKRRGGKADLLIHGKVMARCPGAVAAFDLTVRKNPDFLRFHSEDPEKTRTLLSVLKGAAQSFS